MASGFLVFLCQPYEVIENKDFSPSAGLAPIVR